MYVTNEDYLKLRPQGSLVGCNTLEALLADAQQDIDGLTYGRITARGIEALTPFQRELVVQAVCEQAEFRAAYADLLSTPFSSYSINGVSMQFDGAGTVARGGVTAPTRVWGLLVRSGLACRRLDGR
jgi:hypothetical protein